MERFRKKPVVVETVRFDGSNFKECEIFIEGNFDNTLSYPHIETLEGIMRVNEGDYIIKGVEGEFYPCKPDIFKQTYEDPEPTTTLYAIRCKLSGFYVGMQGELIDLGKLSNATTSEDIETVEIMLRGYEKCYGCNPNLEIVRLDITPTPIKGGE